SQAFSAFQLHGPCREIPPLISNGRCSGPAVKLLLMKRSTILADQTCIYCQGSGVKFNREHVIPEAFGKFKDNFVLTCVCVNCNQFFGDELELVLGRNSREAILRLHHGVKAPAGAAKLKYDRVE